MLDSYSGVFTKFKVKSRSIISALFCINEHNVEHNFEKKNATFTQSIIDKPGLEHLQWKPKAMITIYGIAFSANFNNVPEDR